MPSGHLTLSQEPGIWYHIEVNHNFQREFHSSVSIWCCNNEKLSGFFYDINCATKPIILVVLIWKYTYFDMRRNRQQKGFSVFDCRLFSLACTSFCRFGRRCRILIVWVSFCLLCKLKSTRILVHLCARRRFFLARILLLRRILLRKLLVNNIIIK